MKHDFIRAFSSLATHIRKALSQHLGTVDIAWRQVPGTDVSINIQVTDPSTINSNSTSRYLQGGTRPIDRRALLTVVSSFAFNLDTGLPSSSNDFFCGLVSVKDRHISRCIAKDQAKVCVLRYFSIHGWHDPGPSFH